MSKTHWKKLAGKDFLTGEDLDGKEVKLTIESVKNEEIKSERGTEVKTVIRFQRTEKKLVVNVTNMKTIAKELKSNYVEDWAGKQITLIPFKGRFFGEDMEVVRIKKDFSNVKV